MTDEEMLRQLRAIDKPSDPYVSLTTLCAQAADRIEALLREVKEAKRRHSWLDEPIEGCLE
jgi:hypothetical protein